VRTLKELAQEALDVQDACNLSGVAQGFAQAMIDLRRECPGASTDWYNQHWISKLWADKINDLARCYDSDVMAEAYEKVYRITRS